MPLVPPCTFIPEADPAFENQSVACQSDTNPGSGCTADIFSLCPLTVDNPENIYCCPFGDGVFADNNGGTITLHGAGCALPGHSFTFPIMNDEMEPMYKTALGGTTQSPWVRIAFEEYCGDGNTPPPSNQYTNKTIITVGNASQPCNDDVCTASIKAFQYGWGTINQGNRCKVTIMDEKGSSFETWVQRLITNPEGAGKPILGVYRMKVQMGWYVTGGAASDECGQGSAQPGVPAGDGENSSYTICSPTMWFLPDMINMHYEGGKFIYELEGVDLVYRAQESRMAKVQGAEFEDNMYFTEAVTLMAQQAFPPFRVRFLALNQKGQITSLKFYQRPDVVQDDPCLGPYGVWNPKELTPMGAIQLWMNQGALAVDQTGQLNTDGTPKTLGITMNYDSTQDLAGAGMFPIVQPDWYTFNCEGCIQGRTHTAGCQDNLPTVGTLILWAGNGVPNCQSSYDDDTINNRMKAVYVVNGGNCYDSYSEVLTEDGWKRIGNIYRHKYNKKVACVDEKGQLQWSKVTNWYRNELKDRKLIKVHLHNSRQRFGSISGAILTDDHPILTDEGYVKVKELDITKHKIHSGTYMPSKEVHEAVIGMILGDGYIRKKSFSFNCTHCEKQRDYVEHKGKILDLIALDKPDKKYRKIKITSKASPYWRSMRKLFYPDGIKIMNDKILENFSIISLAYLFMDDGHLKLDKKLAEIATCCFTIEEVDLLIDKIKELGLDCYRRKHSRYPRIYFTVAQTNLLSKKIAPYVIPSMQYKLLAEHRELPKINLNLEQEPFYDNFDLIRCETKESITKWVYCIGVEKYENFITHSGVGHNCSPVIAFNPVLKWHFNMGMKAGGVMVPTNGSATKQTIGSDDANCVATGGRGLAAILGTIPTFMMNLLGFGNNNAATETQKSIKLHSAANVLFNGVEAELRVQGDPSYWLCSPVSGYGRCVGIVFINPYYLTDIGGDCPAFTLNNGTVCNTILTNKGWWIRGADHQINDGTYITTIKVALPVPGTELEYTGQSVTTGAAALGAWIYGAILGFGGTFANSKSYPLGSLATNGINMGGCPAVFVGGGANCPNGQACTEGMMNCSGTTDPNDDDTCDGFGGIDVPDEDDEP